MRWAGVPAEHIRAWWPLVEQRIEDALEPTLWDSHSVLCDLLTGHKQLWLCGQDDRVDLIIVTQIVLYPKGNSCLIFLAEGSAPEEAIKLVASVLEPWAKEHNCVRIEAHGRAGWARRLEGWKAVSSVAAKEI